MRTKLTNKIKKAMVTTLTMVVLAGTLPPTTAQAYTFEDVVTTEVTFQEFDEINLTDEPLVMKITMKNAGKFVIDFNGERIWFSDAKLFDEDSNLLDSFDYAEYLYNIGSDEFVGDSDLPAGTYYLWLNPSGDYGNKSFLTRYIKPEKTDLELGVSVKKGKSIQLSTFFTNCKDKNLKWSSSKKSVASVSSNGKVKGLKPGTTIIKAYNMGGIVGKLKVEVTK